jgi:hypothetical protein
MEVPLSRRRKGKFGWQFALDVLAFGIVVGVALQQIAAAVHGQNHLVPCMFCAAREPPYAAEEIHHIGVWGQSATRDKRKQ